MPVQQITTPYTFFVDYDGKPLDLGQVWIGAQNQDPQQNQIAVFWDDAGTVPASQPLRTANGYIYRNGAPAHVYTGDVANFSMRVVDVNGRVLVNVESAASFFSAPSGAAYIPYDSGSVRDVLDGAKSMQGYAQLDAYQGRATSVRLTTPGISGQFERDDTDTTTASSGVCRVDGLGRRWKRRFDGDYLDSWWQPATNGSTDAAPAYQAIAQVLPEGAVLRCVGSGTRIIGSEVVFAQDHIKIIFEPGVKFKQKNSTPSLDRLFLFSGDYCEFFGFDLDGNVANNSTATYTGRGELAKFAGNRANVQGTIVRNTHVKDNACGIFITGKDSTVENVTGFSTGRVAIRDKGDRTTIRDVRVYDIADATNFSQSGSANYPFVVGNKVIAKDGGAGDAVGAFTWVKYENIYGHSTGASFYETIVVDDAVSIGGRVICEEIVCDFPNATGPDVIKFVNCRRVDVKGLTTFNGGDGGLGGTNTCLRIQENVTEVYLAGLDLAGHINCDTTTYLRFVISENSRVGRDLTAAFCIADFPDGHLIVDDGVILQNFTTAAVSTNLNYTDGNISLGRCVYNGAASGTVSSRYLVQHRAFAQPEQTKRMAAGQIQVATPTEITNTRTRNDGRWIADADVREAACIQGNDGRYLVGATYMTTNGPPGVAGWKDGDELYRRDPIAGQSVYIWVCTTPGASIDVSWAGLATYIKGTWVANGGNVYTCTGAGTSAASGGPAGTGTGIPDGTCIWDYVAPRAVFKSVGSIAA